MYGRIIAFKNLKAFPGIWGSEWTGFRIGNSIGLSVYQLMAGFLFPIIPSLAMNMVPERRFKKTVQLVTYARHLVSTIVQVGMLSVFLSKNFGLANLSPERFSRVTFPMSCWTPRSWMDVVS